MEPLTAAALFAELVREEWEARLRQDPLFATYCGDHRYDNLLPHATEDGYGRWLDYLREVRRRLDRIDSTALSAADQLNFRILVRLLDNEIRELEFHAYRLPISKAGGFHLDLSESMPQIMPFESVADYENYIARLAAFQRYVGEQIEVMRAGLASGHRPARVTLEGMDDTLRKQMGVEPAQSLLYAPFACLPGSIGGADRERLAAEGRAALMGKVVPAYQALLRFVEEEYLPGARDEIGASHLPDGREFYQHRIHYFTSLDLTPEQVHETGQSEVARIRAEMDELIRAVGFQGDFRAFIEFLRTEPRFYAPTPEALLRETAYVLKRIDGELPRLFKTLPRTPYGIRPIPEASAPGNTTAYYFPAAGDGRTAGFYYVNTYDLKSRPLYEIEALSLHEAVPGHHLQIALQQELDLPPFRRFLGFTEFVEGWALYSERLGLEVGFYQDPYSNFGRLSYEMWRACRLVVDTGMHALGWSRQQAIDFMAANTSSTILNITNEVDRYIAWPGQALAYKIGELKIRELRGRAEQQLGSRFDLREFHDLVLGSGAVPLDELERMVAVWMEAR
jgi:uncharacterized protein (DUF885 family)